MNAHDIELALRARAAFNESAERLDSDTRRRLRELRVRAFDGSGRRAPARWIWPAGMAATAALALAVFVPRLPLAPATRPAPAAVAAASRQPMRSATPSQAAHAAVAATASDAPEAAALETADPDMLSDLEFYGWLAKQPGKDITGG